VLKKQGAPTASSESSQTLDNIDMGDYQQLIRPASAFWRLSDGLTMAEKVIFYRNWNNQQPGEPDEVTQMFVRSMWRKPMK